METRAGGPKPPRECADGHEDGGKQRCEECRNAGVVVVFEEAVAIGEAESPEPEGRPAEERQCSDQSGYDAVFRQLLFQCRLTALEVSGGVSRPLHRGVRRQPSPGVSTLLRICVHSRSLSRRGGASLCSWGKADSACVPPPGWRRGQRGRSTPSTDPLVRAPLHSACICLPRQEPCQSSRGIFACCSVQRRLSANRSGRGGDRRRVRHRLALGLADRRAHKRADRKAKQEPELEDAVIKGNGVQSWPPFPLSPSPQSRRRHFRPWQER